MALGLDQLQLDQLDPLGLVSSVAPGEDGVSLPLLDVLIGDEGLLNLLGLVDSLDPFNLIDLSDPLGLVGSTDPLGLLGSVDPLGLIGSADPLGLIGSTDPLALIDSASGGTGLLDLTAFELIGSNEQGSIVIGNSTLGIETTNEQGQPGGSTDPVIEIGSPSTISLFDDAGSNRIETITVHGIVTEANVMFAGGESTYEPQPGDSDLLNAAVLNGLDGNNLESIAVDGPVELVALWDNTNAGSGTDTSVGDNSNLADGTAVNGLGGGTFDSLTVAAPIIGLEPIVVENDLLGDSNPAAVVDNDLLFAGVLDGANSDNILESVGGVGVPDVGVPLDLGGVQDIVTVPTIDTGILDDVLSM